METDHSLLDMQAPPDIFNPLTTLQWGERIDIIPTLITNTNCQCVFLNDKVFINATSGIDDKHYVSFAPMSDLTSWNSFLIPQFYNAAMSTFHSQLVLVGGKKGLNSVWVSNDGVSWRKSLQPPMPTGRTRPVVVNVKGSSEYLIVAGGYGKEHWPITTVEVLCGMKWFTIQPLPKPMACIKSTVHMGNLYLSTASKMYYCNLESLITMCDRSAQSTDTIATDPSNQDKLWKETSCPSFNLASCGQYLLAFNPFGLYAYSPLSEAWICIEDISEFYMSPEYVTVFKGELLVFVSLRGIMLVRAVFKGHPYDLDGCFSRTSLSRLEGAGIPVATSLDKLHKQLAKAIQLPLEEDCCSKLVELRNRGVLLGSRIKSHVCYEGLIKEWIAGKSLYSPTWRSLYSVMRLLDLGEMAEKIDNYLGSPKSLKEQCASIIMSTLLQQKSLKPDQLHGQLPDYVPSSVKHSITHMFKAHTPVPVGKEYILGTSSRYDGTLYKLFMSVCPPLPR